MIRIAQTFNSSTPSVLAALTAGDRGWIEKSARRQVDCGVDYLECNAGAVDGAEASVLHWLVELVETVVERPLSLDSADADLLVELARRRRRPPLLNGVAADPAGWPEGLTAAVSAGASLVVQLRRDDRLPPDLNSRLEWTEAALAAAVERGMSPGRIWIDPVLLPWGEDLGAGEALLGFLAEATRRWPEVTTLVGLSNVSFGHADRRAIHLRWLPRLREAGLGAVILDPFDTPLMELAR